MTPSEYRERILSSLPTPNYFGDCPLCGRNDGYVNLFRAHWFLCKRHRLRWLVGTNLFSTWRFETEAEWRRNFDRYFHYLEVRPWYRDSEVEVRAPEDSP